MAVFTRAVTFSSLDGQRSETVEAVVDTGAERCLVPEDLAERLQLLDLGEHEVELADGTVRRVRLAGALVTLQDQVRTITTWVGPRGIEPLLGASTLADFNFGVDPQGERLVPHMPRLLRITNWQTW